jgi:hypothetical protein
MSAAHPGLHRHGKSGVMPSPRYRMIPKSGPFSDQIMRSNRDVMSAADSGSAHHVLGTGQSAIVQPYHERI